MEFDLTEMVKKALPNAVNNTLYRGETLNDWINFIANNADDLISRQAIFEAFESECVGYCCCCEYYDERMDASHHCKLIDKIPAIQPEQKTGRWSKQMLFDDGYGGKKVGYICSACRKYAPFKGNYCGNCGAKMGSEPPKRGDENGPD